MNEMHLNKALSAYREAIACMKRTTVDFVNSIEEIPVQRTGSCFTLSLSTIQENGSILSPFYYDVKKQKEVLIEIVEHSKGTEFMSTFAEIAQNGKRTIRSGGASYHQIFAPSVVDAIKKFFQEENIDV